MNRHPDDRFWALLDLAKSDDEAAVHDLWTEYGHDFTAHGDLRDQLPTRKVTETQQHKEP